MPPSHPNCLWLRLRQPNCRPTMQSPSNWRFGTVSRRAVLPSWNPTLRNIQKGPLRHSPEHESIPLNIPLRVPRRPLPRKLPQTLRPCFLEFRKGQQSARGA
jgi:hypothetical protein